MILWIAQGYSQVLEDSETDSERFTSWERNHIKSMRYLQKNL